MKGKSKLSESFVVGIIAIVFLLIGYQVALFIHHSAVTKIAANRDEPDTVYIYQSADSQHYATNINADQSHSGISADERSYTSTGPSGDKRQKARDDSATGKSAGRHTSQNTNSQTAHVTATSTASHGQTATQATRRIAQDAEAIRRDARHSPRAEAVRRKLPRSRTESFPFNPNTVSVEDLCRLGFSEKQAVSIDNYRKKGGRFRRKADFAKSFVVADSVYKRLEGYIVIPKTDLNLADSAAFDALPGIGGWFAAKIIEHRKALKGFSYKEQLLDIYRFDEEKFRALEDLIEVDPAHITPYPLWSLPVDSLRRHPYIRNYETARAIVLYRENTPKDEWTVENLINAGIFTSENAEKMRRVVCW